MRFVAQYLTLVAQLVIWPTLEPAGAVTWTNTAPFAVNCHVNGKSYTSPLTTQWYVVTSMPAHVSCPGQCGGQDNNGGIAYYDKKLDATWYMPCITVLSQPDCCIAQAVITIKPANGDWTSTRCQKV